MNDDDLTIPPGARPDPPSPPEPPPVPAHHPAGKNRIREALRIPVSFYVEALLGFLGLLAFSVLIGLYSPTYAFVATTLGAVVVAGTAVMRMIRRVIMARRKGKPPFEATVVFWLSMLLPLSAAVWYGKRELRGVDAWAFRQGEARAILEAAYQAERGFRKEYGHYTYNIKELGLSPEPGAHYALGFPSVCTARFAVEGAKPSWDLLDVGLSQRRRIETEEFLKAARSPADCRDPKEGFEIFALGELKGALPLDVWRLDERHKPENVQKGY